MAGALRQALERTARLSEPPPITCAGRTDAGVHARGQVVHVDLPPVPYDGPGLARALNRQLAPAVVVRRAEEVGPDFDARRSATGRTYRYLVWNAPDARPAAGPRRLARPRPPRPRAPCAPPPTCCSARHDFRSFCRRRPGTDASEPIVRRVTMARWSVDEGPEATDALAGRGGPPAALRDRGRLVLPPDGPLAGGQPGRGRPGARERGRPDGAPAGGQPAERPIRPRPRACAWSRWPTAPARVEVRPPERVGRVGRQSSGTHRIVTVPESRPAGVGRSPDTGGGLPPLSRGPILVCRLAGPPGALSPAPGRVSGDGSLTTRMRKIGLVRTFSPKVTEIQRAWYVVDADGLVLGRLASVGGAPSCAGSTAPTSPPTSTPATT